MSLFKVAAIFKDFIGKEKFCCLQGQLTTLPSEFWLHMPPSNSKRRQWKHYLFNLCNIQLSQQLPRQVHQALSSVNYLRSWQKRTNGRLAPITRCMRINGWLLINNNMHAVAAAQILVSCNFASGTVFSCNWLLFYHILPCYLK